MARCQSQLDLASDHRLDEGSGEPLSGQLCGGARAEDRVGGSASEGSRLAGHAGTRRGPEDQSRNGPGGLPPSPEAGLARGPRRQRDRRSALRRPARRRSMRTRFSRRGSSEPRPEETPLPALRLIADFSRPDSGRAVFPLEEFTRTLAEAWSRRRDLWQYAPRSAWRSCAARSRAVCPSSGPAADPRRDPGRRAARSRDSISLFRTFTDPGDAVVDGIADLLGRARARAFCRRVGSSSSRWAPDGPDAEAAPRARRAKLVYLMPERQNPTGVTTSGRRRRRDRSRRWRPPGRSSSRTASRSPSRACSLSPRGFPIATIWLGTLSKDLVPGIPHRLDRRAPPPSSSGWRGSKTARLPDAAAAAGGRRRVPARGRGPPGARARAFDVEAKRITAGAGPESHLPGVSWWGGEIGSALFWLHLPPETSGRRVAQAAAARGVGVAPGADFDPKGRTAPTCASPSRAWTRRNVEQGIGLFAESGAAQCESSSRAAYQTPVV